ncbi:MAG: hypothetical protein UEF48_06465, partial [Agathobaculum butyriciproducens]|nr:hypothetical protein [Agathobaculum butyriciproducens]
CHLPFFSVSSVHEMQQKRHQPIVSFCQPTVADVFPVAKKSRNAHFGTFLQPERRPQPPVDKKKRRVGGVFAAFQAH